MSALLENKTILVTGAGRGIGAAIVETALREGANVVAHIGRDSTHLNDAQSSDENLLAVYGDLSNTKSLDEIWAKAVAWKNRIDVLVNNAGIYAPSRLEKFDEWQAGWSENLSINLVAPAHLCRHAIEHFKETGEGVIVNMASRSSHRGDNEDHLAYGASKGGILALTKGIARSYATSRTLAYAIAPAWVRTEMAENHIANVGEQVLTAELPMREITPASDVAETVVFLASGRARHANGCTVDITGADYVR